MQPSSTGEDAIIYLYIMVARPNPCVSKKGVVKKGVVNPYALRTIEVSRYPSRF